MSTLIFYLKMVAVVFWVFYTSVLYLFIAVFSPRRNNLFAKVVNHLANGILPILGLKLEIEGKENLTLVHPCVFIGNHQSALDVVIYGALCPPNTVAIGKKEISWIPLFGWLFKLSGGILIDRKNKMRAISQIDDANKRLGKNVIAVIKSTVEPGTTDRLNGRYSNVTVIFNPEFLTEANSFNDFKNQNRIIIGGPRPETTTV
ncbi:MAG: 1-acyl-sn-glycerol-3-phosphate acyltransferase, partial [Deltaproteobacteria bacterium]